MQKWEYKVTESDNHKFFTDDANAFGEQGWELVHIECLTSGHAVGFFKRRKAEERNEPETREEQQDDKAPETIVEG